MVHLARAGTSPGRSRWRRSTQLSGSARAAPPRGRPARPRARSAARRRPPTRAAASAHAAPCGHRPGSASIPSSISSSVPCRCPTTGTPGATSAAASLIGVRWCRCSTSAFVAAGRLQRARPRARPGARTSPSSSEAKTRSGAPGRSSKDGCIGGSASIGSGAASAARQVHRAHVEPGVELARVARAPGRVERARDHRDVPARRRPARGARLRATCADPRAGRTPGP